jgi:DNA polymerase
MRTKRRANTFLKKLQTLHSRVRPDGRASLPLKYAEAITRRWAGDGGFNSQNTPREAVLEEELRYYKISEEGVNLRKCIIAAPGKKLVSVDSSQIEPRCLAVLSGNWEKVKLMASGMDIYEIRARQTFGYDRPESLKAAGKADPKFDKLRRMSKAAELALPYGVGKDRFVESAWILAQVRITAAESANTVEEFRTKEAFVMRMWRKLSSALKRAVVAEEPLKIILPSGNTIVYRDPKNAADGSGIKGLVCKMGKMCRVKLYPGKLVENLCQAVARDLFGYALLRARDAGYPLVLQSHDEGTWEVDEDVPDSELEKPLCVAPPWMRNIPLAAESSSGSYYSK